MDREHEHGVGLTQQYSTQSYLAETFVALDHTRCWTTTKCFASRTASESSTALTAEVRSNVLVSP